MEIHAQWVILQSRTDQSGGWGVVLFGQEGRQSISYATYESKLEKVTFSQKL